MKLCVRPAGALLLIAGLSGCDVPTGIPLWETTWLTPAEEVSVSVAELLPGGIQVNADTSAFLLDFAPVSEAFALSAFCPACPASVIPVPKPAFTASVTADMPLPADVHEIVVSGGTIDIALTHDFDFDPIRPGVASDSGSITITATSAGDTVATLVIDGADQAFAPGDTLRESLAFQPSEIQDSIQFEFTIDSPAGDNTSIDTTDEFEVEISSSGVLVSEATVGVASQPIAGTEVDLDLGGIDFDGITEGTLVMEIRNPFSVTGSLTLSVEPEGTGGPIEKNVTLLQGTNTTEVTFDEAEITQMAGEVNTVTIDGVLNAVGGEVTVRPDMVIGIEMRLRATVEVGGSGNDSGS